MTTADKYVAAAYFVLLLVILAWLLIVATKLSRLEREISELAEVARTREPRIG